MKLSKYASITLTSASALVYGFGVAVSQVGAEVLVTDEVSTQIEQALGEPDFDEQLVDGLTQVEYEIKALGVEDFELSDEDTDELARLKQLRQEYVTQLRERMSNLEGFGRQAFLAKIRERRTEVRVQMRQIREQKKQELLEAREKFRERVGDRVEELREDKAEAMERREEQLQNAREQFKENVDSRLDRAAEARKSAQEKLNDRVEAEKLRRVERAEKGDKAVKEIRDKNLERQKVQGAVDYQPANVLERIGFWLQGI